MHAVWCSRHELVLPSSCAACLQRQVMLLLLAAAGAAVLGESLQLGESAAGGQRRRFTWRHAGSSNKVCLQKRYWCLTTGSVYSAVVVRLLVVVRCA